MTPLLQTDAVHLARAIELAEGGRGRTSPNPLVGAVVVKDGEVIGEGFHTAYGAPHAEREALAACGDADTHGATLYVSLEPCCHHGQTPPCTDALIEAGIARVVVGSDDPTEKASGRGLGILRDEGVEVVVADGEPPPAPGCSTSRSASTRAPAARYVLFKSAMTLDGKVATRTGDSQVDLRRGVAPDGPPLARGVRRGGRRHRHRAGRRPAADRPRRRRAPPAAPDRVRLRGPPAARLPARPRRRRARRSPSSSRAPRPRLAADALEVAGADVIVATGENEPARVRNALAQIGATGVTSILLEGGPHLAGAFLDAGEVDEIRLFVAPVVLGGSHARDPLEGEGVERIAEATRALTLDCSRVAGDVLISARLREW